MAVSRQVADFVGQALTAGRSRADIRAALVEAGWSEGEVREALGHYAEVDFIPPVPRPRPHVTARDVFLYALLFTLLGLSAFNLVSLFHGLIDLWLPDPAFEQQGYRARYSESRIRWAIAVLAIGGPLWVWLQMRLDRNVATDPGARRSAIRKWLTYIAVFIAIMVFLGDAITVLYRFLNGDLTLRFLLKALTVAVVAGAVFLYYGQTLRDGADD